jgi:hypothetical protein
MDTCSECSKFSQRLNIYTASEYQDIARQLIDIVEQGTLVLVRADCSLQEILKPTLPGDFVVHEFRCFACGCKFRLSADTYHGSVSWIAGEFPEPRGSLSKPN